MIGSAARSAIAAVFSLVVAGLFRLPEAYWAPITTLVITQSSLSAALNVSGQYFVGTALGAGLGAVVAGHVGPPSLLFGLSVFILGLLTTGVRTNPSVHRLAAVTLAIVLLVPRPGAAWLIGVHRFAEVSIGLVVALIFSLVWPENADRAKEPDASVLTFRR